MISFVARKTRLVCRLAIVALVCSSLSSGALAQIQTSPERTPITSATGPIPSPGAGGTSVGEPLPVSGSASLLPRDLSPWGMFLSADVVVKVVMAGLALASLVTWTVALAKSLEIFTSRRRLRAALRELTDAPSLAQAASFPDVTRSLRDPVEAALAEIRLSPEVADKDSIKERIVSRLERVEAATGRALVRGTGALATIGATAPFIGLFGTVWGIMNSFIGISQQHTTNLAVVAPRHRRGAAGHSARTRRRHSGGGDLQYVLAFDRQLPRALCRWDRRDSSGRKPRSRPHVAAYARTRQHQPGGAQAMSVRLNHGEVDLGEVHEINVTPFIDVILVLLIIFMIAAPLATVDVAVDLSSNAQRQPRPDKPLYLTVRSDLSCYRRRHRRT
jgi:biopolymer transport protein ExbB